MHANPAIVNALALGVKQASESGQLCKSISDEQSRDICNKLDLNWLESDWLSALVAVSMPNERGDGERQRHGGVTLSAYQQLLVIRSIIWTMFNVFQLSQDDVEELKAVIDDLVLCRHQKMILMQELNHPMHIQGFVRMVRSRADAVLAYSVALLFSAPFDGMKHLERLANSLDIEGEKRQKIRAQAKNLDRLLAESTA